MIYVFNVHFDEFCTICNKNLFYKVPDILLPWFYLAANNKKVCGACLHIELGAKVMHFGYFCLKSHVQHKVSNERSQVHFALQQPPPTYRQISVDIKNGWVGWALSVPADLLRLG